MIYRVMFDKEGTGGWVEAELTRNGGKYRSGRFRFDGRTQAGQQAQNAGNFALQVQGSQMRTKLAQVKRG